MKKEHYQYLLIEQVVGNAIANFVINGAELQNY